ncbi:hypothetical protein BWQ96_01813 [Gracilariopsis chorda]|uniref:Uncharacterized protein n=1 Tax=Gracilariopsis chorda TaxID=448386 RepID=A0A2V3J1Z3_9FLOR|nr:hypothetical protein BWQ96_01813 [Gracilariopsis chorda]|eukprot:PXF48353.1 hypothetical protein BWQ96_01813 [Gracilariopsis chorda]
MTEQLKRNSSPAWMKTFHCSQKGLDEDSEWDLHGFYEDKFNDPSNFNLSENAVSLITALLTAFSLILFTDIMYRIAVRARSHRVSKKAVFRYHLLNSFSNPINLLSCFIEKLRSRFSASAPVGGTQNLEWNTLSRSTKRTYTAYFLMGLLTIFVEFLFIFLATNQNKVYDLQLEVPIFEFEDRGCDRIASPVTDSCIQQPLTEKAGFDSRAYLQICSTLSIALNPEGVASTLGNPNYGLVLFALLDTDGVDVTVMYRQINMTQSANIAVILEDGDVYQGLMNVSAKSILSALSNRLRRSNATVLDAYAKDNITEDDSAYNLSITEQIGMPDTASVIVDLENLDLRETHASLSLYPNSSEVELNIAMVLYLHDVARSIMFPTGRARGVKAKDEVLYLDEVETPLAYYNRPWLGVLQSLIICGVLLLIWVFFEATRVKSDIDPRLAWKEFFRSTLTVEDFARGDDEWKEMCWRCDTSGNRSFGFSPRT